MNRQTALITGASGGIGYDFAHIFAQNNYDLVLIARSKEKLEELRGDLQKKHGIIVRVIAKDLANPNAPDEVYAELKQAGISVDILVNNAGYATYGRFAELDLNRELQMMQLNMITLTHLTRLFLPDMVARRQGKILNVASTAAFMPGPLMAVYYASKAYVLSFSEAIANELQGTGVTVTALCPGPTQTGFQARASMQESRLVQGGLMDSYAVAKVGYDALMAGKPMVIPGLRDAFLAFLPRLFPRKLVTRIVRNTQERVGH